MKSAEVWIFCYFNLCYCLLLLFFIVSPFQFFHFKNSIRDIETVPGGGIDLDQNRYQIHYILVQQHFRNSVRHGLPATAVDFLQTCKQT